MNSWSVHVVFEGFAEVEITEEQWDAIMEAGGSKGLSCGHNPELGVFSLTWTEESSHIAAPLRWAGKTAVGFMRAIGHGDEQVIKVEVSDHERPTDATELYRYADFTIFSGLTRQRIAQLAKSDPAFPKPVMHLSDGTPLFRPLEAIEYASKRRESAPEKG